MNTTFYFLSFALATLLFFIIKLISPSSSTKIKNLPPSPPWIPFIGHLHLISSPLHHALSRHSARHGPIILLRLGSCPTLVVTSYALAEECLAANHPRLTTWRHLTYDYTLMGTADYGPLFGDMRRIVALELFSSHRLESFARASPRAGSTGDGATALQRVGGWVCKGQDEVEAVGPDDEIHDNDGGREKVLISV